MAGCGGNYNTYQLMIEWDDMTLVTAELGFSLKSFYDNKIVKYFVVK